ncbi:MAG: 50S ribosomal protein L3 [Candidatus Zixiibacteriota bacterium]
MKEIIGKKLGMTRIFMADGEAVPVTVIQAGPCPVVQKKTSDKDGYVAYQVGFKPQRKNLVNKPKAGHFAKANVEPTHYLREITCDESEFEVGSELKVGIFKPGERVDVTGISRGLGFAGAMKRHHFQGANKTHGQSDRWRAPGSVGSSSYPSRVFKGQRMAGRMGRDRVTTLNLEIVKIIEDENLMLVKGAVPGFTGSVVKIRSTNRG